jgi:signal transduction histidine kinase
MMCPNARTQRDDHGHVPDEVRVRAARAAGRRHGREHPGHRGGHGRGQRLITRSLPGAADLAGTCAELVRHNTQLDSALRDSLAELRRKNDELQASRARIVAAADAERRRIERDLHDGAQQHLTSLAVRLLLAAKLAGPDADLAGLLEQLGAEVRDTAQELRGLAHGIYPPLLRANGLADALFAAASRATLPTTVQAAPLGRYPADVEVAVYFCCLEALQNACRHAGEGATIRLRVREERGTLAFEVTDDGAGFDAAGSSPGAGFLNMADRLGVFGGCLRVDSAPGQGTRVTGRVPVTPSPGSGTGVAGSARRCPLPIGVARAYPVDPGPCDPPGQRIAVSA